MVSIRKKTIYTFFLSVIAVIFFTIFTLTANRLIFAEKVRSRDLMKLESINRMVADLSASLSDAEQKAVSQYEVNVELTAAALSHSIADTKDDAIRTYRDSAVVKIQKGKVTAPEDADLIYGLTADFFERENGYFSAPSDPSTLIVYSRIGTTPYYYLEWYKNTVLADIVKDAASFNSVIKEAEAAYGSKILLVRKEAASETGMTVLYCSEDFSAYKNTDMMGLTAEEIRQSVGSSPQSLELDGVTYIYSVGEIPSLDGYAILLVHETDIIRQSADQLSGMVSILILILSGMICTGLSLYGYALKHAADRDNQDRYQPASMRKAAVIFGIGGLLFMGVSSLYLYSLNGLHEAAVNGREALDMLDKRIVMNLSRDSTGIRSTIASYIDYGDRISEILDYDPKLRDVTSLEEFAECIQASSITLYDHTGKETVSSGSYIDMYLGTDPKSTTYDFRRILKGVPYIIHEAETDEITGLTQVRIGIRITDASAPGKYGVMLISLDPSVVDQTPSEVINSVLHYMSEEETLLLIAESGSGTILASSDSDLTGKDIYSIGMGESDLTGGLMKNAIWENGQYFVMSSLLDDPVITEGAERFDHSVAYYAVSRNVTNYGVFGTVVNCCVAFIVIYGLLVWFILREYTDQFYIECKSRKAPSPEAASEAAGKSKRAGLAGKLWGTLFGPESYWGTRRPEQRGFIVMEAILFLFLLQQIPLLSGRAGHQDSLYYYILKGIWGRGINLFAIARILILAGEMMLGVILVSFLLGILGRQMGKKGWTVCRLLVNVIQYLALATFIGLALYYLGVEKTTLLAALSILSLAVSLGSQGLIADIIAGLSIIMEGAFDVGDIVAIGDQTGTVLEIGVRTTRILCPGNDIMVIGNQEIKAIINKSRENTVFDISVSVRPDAPVDEIRELLDRELPVIGAGNSKILRGPVFDGITRIRDGRMTLSIKTECKQADVYRTRLYINSELQKLFVKNGIKII